MLRLLALQATPRLLRQLRVRALQWLAPRIHSLHQPLQLPPTLPPSSYPLRHPAWVPTLPSKHWTPSLQPLPGPSAAGRRPCSLLHRAY